RRLHDRQQVTVDVLVAAWSVIVRAGLLSLALACHPLHAGATDHARPSSVRIRETSTHDTLTAGSFDALRAQLQHGIPALQGAKGTHGRTHSDIVITYELDQTAAGCRLSRLEVQLDIEVTLPEWEPGKAVSIMERARWE